MWSSSYNKATFQINIVENLFTQKSELKGVRQRDTISPEIIHLILKNVSKKINWSKWGIKIDENPLTHLRFADDIILISNKVEEFQEMLKQLKEKSEKVGLKMNLSKTKVMTDRNIRFKIYENEVKKVNEYLKHSITFEKQNPQWKNYVLRNSERKAWNICVIPVMTYGVETIALEVHYTNRMRTIQRSIERVLLGISFRSPCAK